MLHPLSKYSLGVIAAILFSMTMASSASALQFLFGPGGEFSGSGGVLSGQVIVDIADVSMDTVSVTVDTTGLDATLDEFIVELYLNFNGDVTNLTADTSGSLVDTTVSFGSNAFMADGDGLYDILAEFDLAPPDDRLIAGKMTTFLLTDDDGVLTMNDFNVESFPAGGHGPFTAVLRAQGLGGNGENSGFFAPIPEPSTITLLGVGLIGLAAYGWRKRRQA